MHQPSQLRFFCTFVELENRLKAYEFASLVQFWKKHIDDASGQKFPQVCSNCHGFVGYLGPGT